MADGMLILVAGLLLTCALAASLVAERLRVPALLLFLAVGMAVGKDGAGWVRLDDLALARRIGIVALALILFEGGLSTSVGALRSVLRPALMLAIPGTILTALLAGLAASALCGLSPLQGLLVGSALAATDGAAVFALLRRSALRARLARILEGEAGLNDPVAVLLVLGFTSWSLHADYGLFDMAVLFVQQLGIGLVCGVAVGYAGAALLQRVPLPTAGLYPVASLAIAALAFGVADVLHGSGFLAVYLAALALAGSAALPAQGTLTVFHDGIAWVAQVALFLTLGLLVAPAELPAVAGSGFLLALFVAFAARPLAVAVTMAGGGVPTGERVLLAWAGLRGAVPVVLATFPALAGVPGSGRMLNITFVVVVVSALLQGTTFEWLANRLGLTRASPPLPRPLRDTGTIGRLGAEVTEYRVGPADHAVGHALRDLPLPPEAVVAVIVRGDEAIPPRGGTRIETGDHLHLMVREEAAGALATTLDVWQHGERSFDRTPRAPRPWTAAFGDPAHPVRISGLAVAEHVRVRADERGALVLLEDGRFALTGPALVVAEAAALQRYAVERLQRARTSSHRLWWRDVLDALES